ncbi:hypothetical protein KQI65_12670 [bacterium]|nr:hypothetical protein [bacterium]
MKTRRAPAPHRLILLVLLPMFLVACTDNPFESEAEIAPTQRTIKGKVQLSDGNDNSGVYLWLSGFNLSTYSDADGAFSFTLPPAAVQGGNGGLSGIFTLYAFLGNYSLRSVSLAVRDGLFVFDNDVVDRDGALRQNLYLQQQFSITTTLSRTVIEADSPRVLTVVVELQAPGAPTEVYFPRMLDGVEGPMFLHNIDTDGVELFSTTVTGIELRDFVQIGQIPHTRSFILNIPQYKLKAGRYELIPYILPHGVTIPLPLLRSLGNEVSGLNAEYVRYPFRRRGGRLDVIPN